MRLILGLAFCFVLGSIAADYRGSQFAGFTNFDSFLRDQPGVLRSPAITAAIEWDELILSWNYSGPPDDVLAFEVRAVYGSRKTKWYSLGRWSRQASARESIREQRDADGDVDTDTLKLVRPARVFEIRITKPGGDFSGLRFLGVSVHDSTAVPAPLLPNRSAWGKCLAVPEKSQTAYPEGIRSWCSPASTSMLLGFWADTLRRSDLAYDVRSVARDVNDPNWPGTGNWPFNMAFAGAQPGLRAYVTRLSDVSELEDWIAAGIPVAVSVAYPLLKGEQGAGNGHLVVCIGFTEQGEVIVNDPGRAQVHQVYPRTNLVRAWSYSGNTVYLVYPENARVPRDRFHHWFKAND